MREIPAIYSFGEWLQRTRLRLDLTQETLAHRTGCATITVRKIESDERRPSRQMAARLALALAIPVEERARFIAIALGEQSLDRLPANLLDPVAPPPQPVRPEAPNEMPSEIRIAHLPQPGTSFIGREQETAQVVERLTMPAVRLVTIVGLGGMGKSRLALAVAQRLLDGGSSLFAGGVGYVLLAGVTNAGLIPSAITAALEIPTQGALDLESSLIRYLSDKRLLLLLDNLEQLPDTAPILERILAGAPGIKILATSRARLHLDAEWLLPLSGLTIPPVNDPVRQTEMGDTVARDTGARYTAVELFVERAGHLQPDFALNASTLPEVNRLCRLVGGMPLAIELAAAWLRVLPLADIATEIESNLDFLATSPQNDDARHRSMAAVFDHSWHLLAENERQALMRIGLFRGGFTRQAAAEIAGASLHTLAGLVDSSWIQLNPQGRYQIHELARQYGEEKLEAEPTSASAARTAHCTYYAVLSKRLEGNWGELSHSHNLQAILLEVDNMWAGWHWATANRNFDAVSKYIVAFSRLADARGLYVEVVGEFEAFNALTHTLLSDGTLAEAGRRQIALEVAELLSELCYLLARAISVERALVLGMDGIEWLRRLRLDGSDGEAATPYLDLLGTMGFVALAYADYPQARGYCQELMQLSTGGERLLAYYRDALHKLGQIAHNEGHFAEGVRHLTECLRLAPPDDSIRIWVTDRLSAIYTDLGDLTQAAHFAGMAKLLAEQSDGLTDIASTLFSETELALAQARFDEAESCLARVERIAGESGNRYMRVRYSIDKARVARLTSKPLAAQSHFEKANALATNMARRKEALCAQAGMGFALLDQGKYEEARGWLLAALRAAWHGKIMPEAIWAVIGLATLQGIAGQDRRAEAWLRLAQSHPSCPARHSAEVEEMCRRLALPEISGEPVQVSSVEELHAALEAVVLELLSDAY